MTVARFIATWGGAGLLPKAPGTWGSLAALPFAWAISHWMGGIALAIAAAAAFAIGLWASHQVAKGHAESDPAEVVIDEVAGQWLTLVVVPPDLLYYAAGFVLFRGFDVIKPWPVSWADRRLHGGLGIMLDDILAAVYAGIALYAFRHFLELP